MEQEQVGRFGSADRAAGLRPQPPAASSQSSIPSAEGRGYIAGVLGHPSLPGTYVEAERQAYERAYDIGRRIRSEAVEELVKALKEARGQVVGFMLECGHSPETAVANVARLDAVLSKHRGEQG